MVFNIYYLILFQKNISKAEIMALINFNSEINTINLAYITKLGFLKRKNGC